MYPEIIIGDNYVYLWELCLHASYIVAVSCAVIFRPQDFPLNRFKIFFAAVIFALSGLAGAKLLSIFLTYISEPTFTMREVMQNAGMAYLGAPLLGLFSLWVFSAASNTSFLENADYFAPFVILARVIGRLGCLMEGCCYGINSKLPWAVFTQYDLGSRHPTQAYAMIAAFSISVTLFVFYKKLRQYKGATLFIAIALYSGMRFFNEFLRVDSFNVIWFLKFSQIAMLIIFIVGIVGVYLSIRKAPDAKKMLQSILSLFFKVLILSGIGLLGSISVYNFFRVLFLRHCEHSEAILSP